MPEAQGSARSTFEQEAQRAAHAWLSGQYVCVCGGRCGYRRRLFERAEEIIKELTDGT